MFLWECCFFLNSKCTSSNVEIIRTERHFHHVILQFKETTKNRQKAGAPWGSASMFYRVGKHWYEQWPCLFYFSWITVLSAACWVYLVQTASSSAAHMWGTGRRGSSPVPGCSRVCRSSRSYLQDIPPTLRCSIQAGHSRRLTFCIHFQPVWTVG